MSNAAISNQFIGHYWDGECWHYLPMNDRDIQRSMRTNLHILDTFKFPKRSGALVISGFDDWVMTIPLERAIVSDKNIVYNAEATPFEANRIESFLRLFDPKMIFGLDGPVLEGLINIGQDPQTLFSGRVVWCRDNASYQQLVGLEGVSARQWRAVGPAAAMECSEGAGAHIDSQEWEVSIVDGEAVVRNRLGRDLIDQPQKTGIKARLLNEPCLCGSHDPRLVFEN